MKSVFCAAMAAAFLLAACGPTTRTATVDELTARGKYLVENVAGCNDCHTPMTAQGPDMSQTLQGAPLPIAPTVPMPWATTAPQIAGIPANFTEEQFVHLLQTGERPDGSHPLPPMPPYRMNEADARAVAAFIKTLPKKAEAGAPAPAPTEAAPAPAEAGH